MMPNDAPTLRETIQTAMESSTPAPQTVETSTTPAPVVEAQTATPAPESQPRTEKGRYAKSDEKPAAAPEGAKKAVPGKAAAAGPGEAAGVPSPAPAAPPVPEPSRFKAPQAWKPALREKWAALPPEVQEEIARREGEVPRALEEAAEAKKFRQRFEETFRPYEGILRATGREPLQAVAEMAQTIALLRTGTPQEKAIAVAQAIQGYGVPIEMLAQALDGQVQAPQRRSPPPVDVRQEFQRYVGELKMQHTRSEAERAVEKVKAASEFWTDIGEQRIRAVAAGLVEADPNLTAEAALSSAYEMLSERTPELSGILAQRKAAEAAKAQSASTQRSRVAASSIKASPAEPVAASGKRSLRETITDAVMSSSRNT